MDFFRYGLNAVLNKEYSRDEIGRYSVKHLSLMTADTAGGQLDPEIAVTATLMDAFDSSLAAETGKLGVQKARTGAKDAFRKALADPVSQINGAVVAKFGQRSPRMSEFFPEGREVFSKCEDNRLDDKLLALRDALQAEETANPGSFPAAVTLAGTLLATWRGIYGAAQGGTAQGAQSAEERRAADIALRTQLYKNVLKIATIFAGQVTADGQERGAERIHFYCPQHLLENRGSPGSPNPPQG
ncbi:MAG: hypothetical protein ABI318_16025 [Chthoniobacteraceae bacterium]